GGVLMTFLWRFVLSLEAVPPKVRMRAAAALGAANRASVVPALLKARASGQEQVAEAAVAALRSLGTTAVAPLVARLGSATAAERASAAEGLGLLGKDARPAVSTLLRLLNDPQMNVKLKAGEALGRIGPGSVEAVPELLNWS